MDIILFSALGGIAIFALFVGLTINVAEKPKNYFLQLSKKPVAGSVNYYLSVLGKNRFEYLILTSILVAIGIGCGVALNNIVASFMLGGFAVIYRKKKLYEQFMQRRAMIDMQVDTALQMIASLQETTDDLIYAMEGAAMTTAAPMRDELIKTVMEYRAGKTLIEALQDLAERTDNRDLDVFVRGVAISEKYGTNTSEVITDISKVISDRIILREEIKNELRGAKLTTSIFLVILPVAIVGIVGFYDQARIIMTTTTTGKIVLDFIITVNFIAWYFSGTQRLVDDL